MLRKYPAPNLREFLYQFVDGYLLGDIASMCREQEVDPATIAGRQGAGQCGYPIVMSVCSGVELLGILSTTGPFIPEQAGEKEFVSYWQNYMYATDSRRRMAAKGVYFLVRHGLAHAFMTKGLVRVYKVNSPQHLTTQDNEVLTIDALALATEFKNSYEGPFKSELVDGTRAEEMQGRLSQVWDAYMGQAYGEAWDAEGHKGPGFVQRFFSSLPKAEPPAAPFSGTQGQSGQGASGPSHVQIASTKWP